MVLAVPDEPARGRTPVFRGELAAVVAKQQYPPFKVTSRQPLLETSRSRCRVKVLDFNAARFSTDINGRLDFGKIPVQPIGTLQ
ncbi:MAG: hypothetical protein JXA30_21755 [Deltaproteobacteria bacterium]|nr:hypothetical protein [Deltaproteobacteria bacterium]